MMVPSQIFIIPQYLMVSKLGMLDTVFALIFPGLVSAFGNFLLRQAFMSLPRDLEEAARIDGCNIGQTFLLIMLMYGKEASNRKQEIDRQHYTIPNQRPKDKHCGKI